MYRAPTDRKSRNFSSFTVSHVTPVLGEEGQEIGSHVLVRGRTNSAEVEVRFAESSGEFVAIADDDVQELTRTDLRDLAVAIKRYQQSVPWTSEEVGQVMLGLNDAIFPRVLRDYEVRSISELGRFVLLTGAAAENLDIVLDRMTGDLTLMIARPGHATRRRPLMSTEAGDLVQALSPFTMTGTKNSQLLQMIIDAARQRSMN